MNRLRMCVITGAVVLLLAPPAPGRAQQTDLALVFKLLDAQNATVSAASGEARRAALGDRLNDGDDVLTDGSTRAAIRFSDDGSLVRMNPSSILSISSEGDPATMLKTIDLTVGEIWGRVTGGGDAVRLQVVTPSGVAAIKGTDFIVRVDETGATTVITLEGVVEFFNDAGTVEVTTGNLVVVPTLDGAPQPREVEPEDIASAAALIEDAATDDETVEVEVSIQDAEGRVRTLILELPRSEARAILGGGE
jgi:hypothetical protein